MIERGIVRSLGEERMQVVVSPSRPEACRTCKSCSEEPGVLVLEVERIPDVAPGDPVVVEVAEDAALGPAVMVFLLPMAALVIGAGLGGQVPRWAGWSGFPAVAGSLAGAVVLLAACIPAVRAYDRRYGRRKPRVRVRKVPD